MRPLFLALVLLLACAAPVDAGPPVFDAVSKTKSASANSLTVSHTMSASANGLLTVCAHANTTTTTITVTYNGVAMTSAVRRTNGGASELFYLAAPATGANNIVASFSATERVAVGGVSFTAVDQSTPIDNATSAIGTSTAPAVTITSAVDDMTVDCLGNNNGSGGAEATNSQTLRWTQFDVAQGDQSGQATAAGAASVTSTWTTQNSASWQVLGMNINAVAAASTIRRRAIQY